MKKTICILMSVVLLSLNICIPVSAAEEKNDAYTREEIVALACEIFPECAEKITAEYTAEPSLPSARGAKLLVKELCRDTPSGGMMSYAEYSDGEILLSVADANPYSYTHSFNDLIVDGGITHNDITIIATSSETDGEFILSNVCFDLYRGAYDRITNVGSYETFGDCFTYGNPLMLSRLTETSTQNAIIKYLVYWPYDTGATDYNQSWLIVEVGGDRFYIRHLTYSQGDSYT